MLHLAGSRHARQKLKSLTIRGETLATQSAWSAELEAKREKLREWLHAHRLGAVLIRRSEDLAWLTAGTVGVRAKGRVGSAFCY